MKPFPWNGYSNLLIERILSPRNIGVFQENTGMHQEMRVVHGTAGSMQSGNYVCITLVVDTTDGIIADAKFQSFGDTAVIGAADAACEVVLRKNYDQARRLSADIIDRKLRDFKEVPAFPDDVGGCVNLVLEAIETAAEKCIDIPLAEPASSPPVPQERQQLEGPHPDWEVISNQEKLDLIKEVIREDIQPYIELDAGGIEVKEFKGNEIIIAYQGACTTCPSATGATLDAIQGILSSRLHPDLVVKPDLSLLKY